MHCETKRFNIGELLAKKALINAEPDYQRTANVWGCEKQQLFLHTLFADYDVPKLYLHKLEGDGRYIHALVDGKQRLQCIWDFLDDKIKLGDDNYKCNEPAYKKLGRYPQKGDLFSALEDGWQAIFKGLGLDVVVIHDADQNDIEEIFSRLNNGEPLNSAEKRNALGGDMRKLIIQTSKHKFFTKIVPILNKRYKHRDIAARFLLIEDDNNQKPSPYCTLKRKFLDNLVKKNKTMNDKEIKQRHNAVNKHLNTLCKIFDEKDPLLKKEGSPQLYYFFVKVMVHFYAGEDLYSQIKKFLSDFQVKRTESLSFTPEQKADKEHHVLLDNFELLTQQGNDASSLETRVDTMMKFFLLDYPKTKSRDQARKFSEPERYVIYTRSKKKCQKCKKQFPTYKEFEADHIEQWAHGGKTILSNARALCKKCNAELNKKVRTPKKNP